MNHANVHVLRAGDYQPQPGGKDVIAPSTITLIRAGWNILVDLGSPHDSPKDLEFWLSQYNLLPANIQAAVLTHNHPDHTELKRVLPPEAKIHGSDSVYAAGRVSLFVHRYELPALGSIVLASGVTLIKTPGHENSMDQSVIVETGQGLVAIVGDLFLNEGEFRRPEDFSLWPPDNQEMAHKSRMRIINEVRPTIVIPGHGTSFRV